MYKRWKEDINIFYTIRVVNPINKIGSIVKIKERFTVKRFKLVELSSCKSSGYLSCVSSRQL